MPKRVFLVPRIKVEVSLVQLEGRRDQWKRRERENASGRQEGWEVPIVTYVNRNRRQGLLTMTYEGLYTKDPIKREYELLPKTKLEVGRIF